MSNLPAHDTPEAFWHTFAESIGVGLCLVDRSGCITAINPPLARWLGRDPADLCGCSAGALVAPADREAVERLLVDAPQSSPARCEVELLTPSGGGRCAMLHAPDCAPDGAGDDSASRPVLVSAAGLGAPGPEGSERADRPLHLDQQRLQCLLEHLHEAVLLATPDERIVAVNPAFTRITGYTAEEVIGRTPRILQSGIQGPEFYRALWQQVATTGRWEGEIWNRRRNGAVFPEWQTICEIRDEQGVLVNYMAIFSDLSHVRRTEEELHRISWYDPLTGLPNRHLFRERVTHALTRLGEDEHLAVVHLDIEGFGALNEALGANAGDRILIALAERLQASLPAAQTLARMQGDNFCLLIEGYDSTAEIDAQVRALIAAITRPVTVAGRSLHLDAHFGVAVAPIDSDATDTLLTQAATAFQRAREERVTRLRYFQREMGEAMTQRVHLESALRAALERHEIDVWYQPQVDLELGRPVALEALVRWHHPQRGLLGPGAFLPAVVDSSLIGDLGSAVLRKAIAECGHWRRVGLDPDYVAINLTLPQLRGADIQELVVDALRDASVPAERLQLEITEDSLVEDVETTVKLLEGLRGRGVRLALDDFGTGYSFLSHLKYLPVDTLKIDKSFVDSLPDDRSDRAMCQAVRALGEELEMTVLAEGVERQEQADWLHERAISRLQGFLYSPPLPPAELAHWWRAHPGVSA